MNTAELLRTWRTKHGMTQTEAALQLGISAPHYSNLERGERGITPEMAAKISAVTGKEVEPLPEVHWSAVDRQMLRDWRDRLRITQTQAAALLSCHRSHYHAMENGRRPISPAIQELLPVLGEMTPEDVPEAVREMRTYAHTPAHIKQRRALIEFVRTCPDELLPDLYRRLLLAGAVPTKDLHEQVLQHWSKP